MVKERVFQQIPAPNLGKSLEGQFKIPSVAIPGTSGTSKQTGITLSTTSSKSRAPPPLTPAPQLKRTESTNPLPPFQGGGMIRPTLDPNVQKQVLSKAAATVNEERTQNPRSQSNPTLAGFSSDVIYVDSPQKGEPEKPKTTAKKPKASQTHPRKSATTVVCPPNPFRPPSPYRQHDDSTSPAAAYHRASPETSRAPMGFRFKPPSLPDSPTDEYSDDRFHYPERHPELLRSASQSSVEYADDDESEADRDSTDDTISNDEAEEVFHSQEVHIPPVQHRHNPPVSKSRQPIALPAQQRITPLRDDDGAIDFGSIDLKRRICDYDAPPRYVYTLTINRLESLKFFIYSNII